MPGMPGRRMFMKFNGVKTFSATIPTARATLGEHVSTWIAEMRRIPGFRLTEDIVVTQSSDQTHHCLSMSVFYWLP